MTSTAFSGDGKDCSSCGNRNGKLCVFDIVTGGVVTEIQAPGGVSAVAWAEGGAWIVRPVRIVKYGYGNGKTGRQLQQFVFDGHVGAMAVTSDGRYLAVGTENHEVAFLIFAMGMKPQNSRFLVLRVLRPAIRLCRSHPKRFCRVNAD